MMWYLAGWCKRCQWLAQYFDYMNLQWLINTCHFDWQLSKTDSEKKRAFWQVQRNTFMLREMCFSPLIIWNRQLLFQQPFKKVRLFVIAFYTAFILKVFVCLRNTSKYYTWFSILFTFWIVNIVRNINQFFFSIYDIYNYITLRNIPHSRNPIKVLHSWQNVCFCHCTATNIATLFSTHTDIVAVDRSHGTGNCLFFRAQEGGIKATE